MSLTVTPASLTLALPTKDCRIPLYSDHEHSRAIALENVSFKDGASPARTAVSTVVRALFDKIENIRDSFVESGIVTRLGNPEVLTLVPGDQVRLYIWSGNKAAVPVETGIAFDQPIQNFLRDISMASAEGGSFGTAPIRRVGSLMAFGTEFKARTSGDYGGVGGCILSGTATRSTTVKCWGVVRPAGQNGGQFADLGIENVNDNFHQQFQCYGDFMQSVKVKAGDIMTVAAPGSWTYHGTAFPDQDVDAKRATYWVPIHLTLNKGTTSPKRVTVRPDQNNPFMRIQVDGRSIRLSRSQPEAILKYSDKMTITLEFLGGTSTVATVELF